MAIASIAANGSGTSFYQSVSGGPHGSALAGGWSESPNSSEPESSAYDIGWYRRGEEDAFGRLEALVSDALSSAAEQPAADPQQLISAAIERAFSADGDAAEPGALRAAIAASSFLGPADSKPASATRRYLAALRSFGVEPREFQHDLLVAMQEARAGHIDPSAVLRSFPVGSSLDAVA